MQTKKGIIALYSLLALAILCCVFLLFLSLKPNGNNTSLDNNGLQTKVTQLPAIVSPTLYRDSLQNVYSNVVNSINTKIDTTTNVDNPLLKELIENRITELSKLQQEINELLKNNSSIADLQSAKKKIDELQLLVEELKQRTVNTENENSRLNALLKAYLEKQQTSKTTISSSTAQRQAPTQTSTSNNDGSKTFSVNDIRVVSQTESSQETKVAGETEQLSVSFDVVNTGIASPNAEIHVIVLKPDGKVLKNNEWEMGSFETISGRKVYSYKSRLDLEKGESKKVQFNLRGNDYPGGTYQIQFYHQGKLIARTAKTLS